MNKNRIRIVIFQKNRRSQKEQREDEKEKRKENSGCHAFTPLSNKNQNTYIASIQKQIQKPIHEYRQKNTSARGLFFTFPP